MWGRGGRLGLVLNDSQVLPFPSSLRCVAMREPRENDVIGGGPQTQEETTIFVNR